MSTWEGGATEALSRDHSPYEVAMIVGRLAPVVEEAMSQENAKALEEAARAIKGVRHTGDPGPVIDELTAEGGWALGMNRAASIVRKCKQGENT